MASPRMRFPGWSSIAWMLAMSGFGILLGQALQLVVNETTLHYWSLGERYYFVDLPLQLAGFGLGVVQAVALSRTGAKIHAFSWLSLTGIGWAILLLVYNFGAWLMPARELIWSAHPLAYAPHGALAWGCFAAIQMPALPHRQARTSWVVTHALGGALGHVMVASVVQLGHIEFLQTDKTLLVMVTVVSAGIVFTAIGVTTGLAFPIIFAERLATQHRTWWIEKLIGGGLIALAALCYAQIPVPEPLPPTVACRFTGAARYGFFTLYNAPGSGGGWSVFYEDAGDIVCYNRVDETGVAGERWRMVAVGDTQGWLPEYQLQIGVQGAAATATLSPPGEDLPLLSSFLSQEPYVKAIAFSPDGTIVAAAIQDVGVRQWRIATGEALPTLGAPEIEIEQLVLSSDGRTAVTLGRDGVLRWWDAATGTLEDEVLAADHLTDTSGHLLISGPGDELFVTLMSVDSGIQRWDLQTHTRIGALPAPDVSIWRMRIDASGTRLACGTIDGTIYLLDAGSGRQLHTLEGHVGNIWALDFSPDGRLLASGAYDSTIRLWDVAEGALVQRLGAHNGGTFGLAFSRTGQSLLSAGIDGTARVWDITSGAEIARGSTQTELSHLALSPDGRIGAAGGKDGFVYLWQIPEENAER